MYQRILVPMALDHDISPQTLEVAKALCGPDGEIIGLHVYEAPHESVRAYLDEEILKEGYESARALLHEKVKGLERVTPKIIRGHTSRSIIDYAARNDVDCIVIGSHRPGLSNFFLGSTAARVVRFATCAVHVYRSG
ncbi:universal stress protein [Marivita sp. S2033]|uniref:universal stress protein n=1 Tax=Marivita sp. S2033 TaxID=3373187 RepID=UPI0039822EA3